VRGAEVREKMVVVTRASISPPSLGLTASRRRHSDWSARRERAAVRGAQAGSRDALELLFRWHWPRAHRAAYLVVHDSAAAEDIAQEAFLSALRALDGFDRRRPFGPWLGRIVVNRAIDYARARALRREVGSEPPSPAADPAPPGGWSDAVTAALAGLDPEQRAVIVLRYLLEYTPGEIAAALGLPRGTVNSRLRRGLDRLAIALKDQRP
jgi:RNA polymerase sigma-70 factor, ECF subfamily